MDNDFVGQDVAMNLDDIRDRQVGHRCMLYEGNGSGSNVDKVVTLISRSVRDRTIAGYRTSTGACYPGFHVEDWIRVDVIDRLESLGLSVVTL